MKRRDFFSSGNTAPSIFAPELEHFAAGMKKSARDCSLVLSFQFIEKIHLGRNRWRGS
jgi:hypothetical protein